MLFRVVVKRRRRGAGCSLSWHTIGARPGRRTAGATGRAAEQIVKPAARRRGGGRFGRRFFRKLGNRLFDDRRCTYLDNRCWSGCRHGLGNHNRGRLSYHCRDGCGRRNRHNGYRTRRRRCNDGAALCGSLFFRRIVERRWGRAGVIRAISTQCVRASQCRRTAAAKRIRKPTCCWLGCWLGYWLG